MNKELAVTLSVNGPVVKAENMQDFQVREMVMVGEKKLLGEVISLDESIGTIQVYEETEGLRVGERIHPTDKPLSLTLGPGMIGNIFDGIQRPLEEVERISGEFIAEGIGLISIDMEKIWDVEILIKDGDYLTPGMVYAHVQESDLILHKVMVPPGVSGEAKNVLPSGKYNIDTVVARIQTRGSETELRLYQKWPVRTARPVAMRRPIEKLLVTGQRVLDIFFPIAKGGTAALPGGFGTGKTMTQHQLAKWSDADIIVYIGCGERGNEMTEVLEDFPKLIDPKSNKPLMDRTILIANTSNMPVAAREASIYTGITIAEYYRDMGYHVAIMADSTSRWAEALREISGRLEEMPAEEGYPAYLPSRLAQFYERAGYVKNTNYSEGSVSIIGAVSPQGADFSEPVTQNTKRFVRCFWALDKQLAYIRHYSAINWNLSYSEYVGDLSRWYNKNLGPKFLTHRNEIMTLLAEENKLMEIVKLIGSDVLPDDQKLIIEISKVIRVGFLQQNAFHKDDTYVPLEKQLKMMEVILYLNRKAREYISSDKSLNMLIQTGIFENVTRMKYDVPNDNLGKFDEYYGIIDKTIAKVH